MNVKAELSLSLSVTTRAESQKFDSPSLFSLSAFRPTRMSSKREKEVLFVRTQDGWHIVVNPISSSCDLVQTSNGPVRASLSVAGA